MLCSEFADCHHKVQEMLPKSSDGFVEVRTSFRYLRTTDTTQYVVRVSWGMCSCTQQVVTKFVWSCSVWAFSTDDKICYMDPEKCRNVAIAAIPEDTMEYVAEQALEAVLSA